MQKDSRELKFQLRVLVSIEAVQSDEFRESSCALARVNGIVHSAPMSAGESQLTGDRSGVREHRPAAKSLPPSQLGGRGCEQVAAVCYRIRRTRIEFLLVRTRRGRWIFPKGGVELGLTNAQAAALEAFEEAGVHGRIEEAPFARYRHRKRGNMKESSAVEIVVDAHLCEVLRLGPPQEPGRNRTWFSAETAKSRLSEDRMPDKGAELARVVDRAVARIQRLGSRTATATDALQKVQFEASDGAGARGRTESASFVRYIRHQRGEMGDSAALEFAVNAYLSEVLRLNPAQHFNEPARLIAERARRHLYMKHAPDCVAGVPRVVEGTSAGAGTLQKRHVIEINKPPRTMGEAKLAPSGRKNRNSSPE